MSALPIIIKNYHSVTMNLGTLEHGAAILLMMALWEIGPVPDDDEELASITKLAVPEWRRIKPRLLRKLFQVVEGSLICPMLDDTRARFFSGRRLSKEWLATRAVVFERDDYTCQYCGARGGNLECDHVLPVSRGGSSLLDNLATSCRACNREKGNSMLEEWRGRNQ